VRRECAVADAALVVAADGQPGIDVTAGVLAQLDDCNVTVVWRDSRCTAEDADLFSYRRDGRTGRHGIAICLSTDTSGQG
jgi:copper oxidase (laccase) domain-containing protein